MALNRIASHFRRDSASRRDSPPAPPSPGPGAGAALDDHNQWLRMLTAEYNERVSRASEDDRRSGGDSELSSGRWDSGRWGDVYDPYQGMGDMAEQGVVAEDEYTEEPIYRGLCLDQPVGEERSQLADLGGGSDVAAADASAVDQMWLSANPPLIRRQKAFAASGM